MPPNSSSLAAIFRQLAGMLLLAGPVSAQPYDPAPATLRIMSWNVEWMFDNYLGDNHSALAREQSAPSDEYWQAKLDGVAEVVADSQADIVALQEIEGAQTLYALTQRLQSAHQLNYRYVFIEGSDRFTEQDVGFLYRDGLISYRRHEQTQAMFDSRQFYNLSKHLVAEFRWSEMENPLTFMNLHLRARAEAEDLRVRQARLARHWLESALQSDQDVIVLGDLNSEHWSGTAPADRAPANEVTILAGSPNQVPMVDLLSHLPDPRQSTHAVLEKQFDRLLVSRSLMRDDPGQDWNFESIEVLVAPVIRGQADGTRHWQDRLTMPIAELDLSDHFPILATFNKR